MHDDEYRNSINGKKELGDENKNGAACKHKGQDCEMHSKKHALSILITLSK